MAERDGGNDMTELTLSRATDLIRLAIDKAAADYGKPICVAVCDASGALLAFARAEGSPLRSIAISQGKAYSAARMQANTDAVKAKLAVDGVEIAWFCDEKLTALPGGAVLKTAGGAIAGAVGISGLASDQDQAIANALAATFVNGAV
jgi:uncharacterized protein GlcG (DUF336 family)